MTLFKRKANTKKAQAPTAAEREASAEGIQELKPVKRRKKRYILLYIAAIGFAFYAVITIINQNVKIAEKKAELSELQPAKAA